MWIVLIGNRDLKGAHLQCYQFWSAMNDKLVVMGKPFNARKTTGDHWYDVAIGNSDAHIQLMLTNEDNCIVLGLLIQRNILRTCLDNNN